MIILYTKKQIGALKCYVNLFFFFAINMIVMSTQFQYKQIHTKQPGYLLIELPETKLIMY